MIWPKNESTLKAFNYIIIQQYSAARFCSLLKRRKGKIANEWKETYSYEMKLKDGYAKTLQIIYKLGIKREKERIIAIENLKKEIK